MPETQLTHKETLAYIQKKAEETVESSRGLNQKFMSLIQVKPLEKAKGEDVQFPQMESIDKIKTNLSNTAQSSEQAEGIFKRIRPIVEQASQGTDLLQKNKTSHKKGAKIS